MDALLPRRMVTSRRVFLLGTAQAALLTVPLLRLLHLQVREGEKYRTLADGNRIALKPLQALRGRIVSADGVVLADSNSTYRAVLALSALRQLPVAQRQGVIELLAQLTNRSEAQLRRAGVRLGQRGMAAGTHLIADNLNWQQFAALALHLPQLQNLKLSEAQQRQYPHAALYASIVGYVAPISRDEREQALAEGEDEGAVLPDARIGRAGIEEAYDEDLRGTAGFSRIETDNKGHQLRELDKQPAEAGTSLVLTLNHQLQQVLAGVLQTVSAGAATLVDVRTGHVLAAYSHPAYDPNLFVNGIDTASWEAITTQRPPSLLNRLLNGLYPPGSIFKPVIALAGLDKGVIAPEDKIFCPGYFEHAGRRFHCWKKTGHGSVNLVQALQYSCDTYFYSMGLRTGLDSLAQAAHACGLGAVSGTNLSGEKSGVVPDTAWINKRYKRAPRSGDVINTSIGQGNVLCTPLQAVRLIASIASGVCRPLTLDASSPPLVPAVPLPYSAAVLNVVRQGLSAVCNTPDGTAHAASTTLEKDGFLIAGKTGTAQVRRISAAERLNSVIKNDALPEHLRDHAWFTAYAPADNPRYAVAVLAEHGGSGSGTAAPMAREILRAVMRVLG